MTSQEKARQSIQIKARQFVQLYQTLPSYVCLPTKLAQQAGLQDNSHFDNLRVIVVPDFQEEVIFLKNKLDLLLLRRGDQPGDNQ